MGGIGAITRVASLAGGQWGVFTTAQAEAQGITRLQLSRLTDSGLLERTDRGIYALTAASDGHTALRTAWMSLAPKETAEERLRDPLTSGVVSHTSAAALHGIGDLLDDEAEFTVSGRKQSRRGHRIHQAKLLPSEVTIALGLPVTTPARTVADLLRDGHDPSHVAEVAGDTLRRSLATREEIATALEPLARRNSQPSGSALLENLLDMVGLSNAALATMIASSELGKALVASGQMEAIRTILGSGRGLADSSKVVASLQRGIAEAFPHLPVLPTPTIDLSAMFAELDLTAAIDIKPLPY